MTSTPHTDRGNIVTYLDIGDDQQGRFCRAVVTGADVLDPETDLDWMPIVRPNGEPTLLDPALIVTTTAERAGPDTDANSSPAVRILADALAVLAQKMTELDERTPTALRAARVLLTRFVDAITPIEQALRGLADVDPEGGLATVLGCLGSAAQEIEHGRIDYGKAGILIAGNVMADLVDPQQDDLWDGEQP